MYNKALEIAREVKKVIVGKDGVVHKSLMAVMAGGHILLEDIPGVGKTTLALAFSRAMSLSYGRVQFTPDIMPSDITGFSVYDRDSGALTFRPGPVLCNLFLADEINRASSKTQSALLEVMEEGNVTVDGAAYATPKPFVVIATQNPLGFAGTQMLPESQLDRFMVCLSMGYPSLADEVEIMRARYENAPMESVARVADAEDVLKMQRACAAVYIAEPVYDYIARLAAATRDHRLIRLGISPRGSLAIASMSRAAAFLSGRDFVVPDDVAGVFADVSRHRLVLTGQSRINSATPETLLHAVLSEVPPPRIDVR